VLGQSLFQYAPQVGQEWRAYAASLDSESLNCFQYDLTDAWCSADMLLPKGHPTLSAFNRDDNNKAKKSGLRNYFNSILGTPLFNTWIRLTCPGTKVSDYSKGTNRRLFGSLGAESQMTLLSISRTGACRLGSH
jgi:hypothetical protein